MRRSRRCWQITYDPVIVPAITLAVQRAEKESRRSTKNRVDFLIGKILTSVR